MEEFGGAAVAVEFFYCLSCPWSYLAFARLAEAAMRTGVGVVYRPVIGAWLPGADRWARPYERLGPEPAVRRYVLTDLAAWARFCSVKLNVIEGERSPPEWAQRAAVLAARAGRGRQYVEAMYREQFESGCDITSREKVLQIAAICGLDGAEFETELDGESTRTAVRRNGEELLARGGFAAPTMFIGSDLYFGHDRIPLVEMTLLRVADRPFVAPGEHGRLR